jgi:hypothetical protein
MPDCGLEFSNSDRRTALLEAAQALAEMSDCKFLLGRELGDGQHRSIVADTKQVLEAVETWLMDNADTPGAGCFIRVIKMSDAEMADPKEYYKATRGGRI